MKTILRNLTAAVTLAAIVTTSAVAASPGYVDFGKFSPTVGEQYVEVDINPALLRLAAAFTKHEEPEVANLISSLERVKVNVFGLHEDNRAESIDRINAVRADLDAQGWTRVVTVREKSGEDIAVFIKEAGEDVIHGVVVTVIGNNDEAVLVNIVGNVEIEQIARLGESLDIGPLRHMKLEHAKES